MKKMDDNLRGGAGTGAITPQSLSIAIFQSASTYQSAEENRDINGRGGKGPAPGNFLLIEPERAT